MLSEQTYTRRLQGPADAYVIKDKILELYEKMDNNLMTLTVKIKVREIQS